MSNYVNNSLINILFVALILITSFHVIITPSAGMSIAEVHENISGNINDLDCNKCHPAKENPKRFNTARELFPNEISYTTGIGSQVFGNLSVHLNFGQTPYQLGPFFLSNGYTGLSWWDVADSQGEYSMGTEIQKNMISLMILDNSTGTVRPITGLVTPPVFPQVIRRNHSAGHSYKADIDEADHNYPNNIDLWMVKEIDLTGSTDSKLSFWTWYSLETDWDYGYVMLSINGGNSWTTLSGNYTTDSNPNGQNLGNGITGTSSGWIQESMNLSQFDGARGILAFRFRSDTAVNGEGWYIDDINITSGSNTIISDDAETPFIKKKMSLNVTYPHLSLVNWTNPLSSSTVLVYENHTQSVELHEDIRHPGSYLGYFLYNAYDEFYSGNYTVYLDTTVNDTRINVTTGFQTTLFGCNNCHNKFTDANGINSETSFLHGSSSASRFCTFACHSGSRGFYWAPEVTWAPLIIANPMHVHEMQFGHNRGFQTSSPITAPYDVPAHVPAVSCVQCHTNFLHDNRNPDTAVIGSYTLYGKNITFSSGTHANLTCEECHGSLEYPAIPPDQFQMQGVLGAYMPDFTSSIAFTDTYIIDVDGTKYLNITITGDTKKKISLYTIGPVDNTTTGLMGPCPGGDLCEIIQSLEAPLNLNISGPYIGTWIAKIIQRQEGPINYTISSSYPLQKKPIIQIPECSKCHNNSGEGKAYTSYQVPDWNPGFAHADINDDGTTDIQCRTCHGSMHDIRIRKCQDCHTTAPVNHPVRDTTFMSYSSAQCLACHGDPHRVTLTGGTDCTGCHSPGDANISLFGRHSKMNTSDGEGNVTNPDCWTCHFEKDMNRSNVYLCESCHINSSGIVQVNDTSLIKSEFMHGMTSCKTCHAPSGYHQNGTVAPLGLPEIIMKKVLP